MIFTEQTAAELVQKVVKLDDKGTPWHLHKENLTDQKKYQFNPIFWEALDLYRRIRVHFDGRFPAFLFEERAPRESQEEFEYRKKIYKAITKAWMGRALGAVARVWNDKNYTVEWYEKSDEEYFNQEYPKYGNIWAYFEQVVTVEKLKDPNAVIAHRPSGIPTTEDGEVDQTKKVEPVAVIYHCDQVLKYVEEDYCLILLNEKAPIVYDKQVRYEGRIFELYDAVNIWRITQTSKNGDTVQTFEVTSYYKDTHGLGYLPVTKLKGTPLQREEEILYESYFAPAIPSLESALLDHSTLQMVKYAFAFPVKWQYTDECGNKECNNGLVNGFDKEGNSIQVTCGVCKGTGRSAGGPLAHYEIALSNQDGSLKQSVPTPPAGFITPETAIMEFLWKQVTEYLQSGYSILNLEVSNSFAKGDDTALGKQIDREEFFSFLMRFSNELFETLEFSIKTIGILRNGESYQPPAINRPTNFTIRDDQELTEELANVNIPDFARRKILKAYNNSRFINDRQAEKMFNVISRLDKHITKSTDEILRLAAAGYITKRDVLLHYNLQAWIESILIEEPDFLDRDFESEIKDTIDQLIDVELGLLNVPQRTIANNVPDILTAVA